MRLLNENYNIKIKEWNNFELDFDKEVDLLFDPKNHISSEFSKTWRISIDDTIKHLNIILVDHVSAPCSCILHESELIILLDGYIAILDLKTYKLMTIDNLENHGCFFAIYEYDEGYIIHGEQELIKLSNDFIVEWSFSGSDIFVRADGSECFRIIDDKVKARCWDGLEVLLDTKGMVIKESYNK